MSPAKKALIAAVALYVVIILSGFLLPDQTVVSRNAEVRASMAETFGLVSEHKQFNRWSPWLAYDPSAQISFEGPEKGIGSIQTWRSEHPKLGRGQAEYIAYKAPEFVEMDIQFEQGGGTSSFQLSPHPDNGHIVLTWKFSTKHSNIFERFIGFFMFEGMIGPELEAGLSTLQELVNK